MPVPALASLVPQVWDNNVALYTWTLAQNSAGPPIQGPGWTDRSIQFTGNFSGCTCTLQGSNDGINYFTLHDPFGNLLSFTNAGLAAVTEICWWIQPVVQSGSISTAISAALVCGSHNRN